MAEKDKLFSLTKAELDKLTSLVNITKIQEELLIAVRDATRGFIVGGIFKRLGLKEEDFKRSSVDLGAGNLVIKVEERKEEKK